MYERETLTREASTNQKKNQHPISYSSQLLPQYLYLKITPGTSLVVQWLKIGLPMQGTRVLSLVGKLRTHMARGN